MPIKILKQTQTTETYNVDLSDFFPCCESWAAEFGSNIILSPDNSGILPDNIFQRGIKMGNIQWRQLTGPFHYCPYCGQAISYQLHDGNKIIDVEAGEVVAIDGENIEKEISPEPEVVGTNV